MTPYQNFRPPSAEACTTISNSVMLANAKPQTISVSPGTRRDHARAVPFFLSRMLDTAATSTGTADIAIPATGTPAF